MKIGLLLGSFNPITIGHIAMVSNILQSGLCDKVLLVVAKHNPWKGKPISFDIRCEMIKASIEPFGDKCEVSRLEEDIQEPTYSYLTIRKAKETYPNDELFLICGTDTIEKVPYWKNFDTDIRDNIKFIEISRNRENNDKREIKGIGEIKLLMIPRMDVSSTMVREMVSNGFNPYPYVTENVYKIILDNKLYER